jgi:putative acetyltransferase
VSDALQIRPEVEADHAAIREVNERAFGQPDEAALVDALRRAGGVILSLVAERSGAIVGHILFSPVTVETGSGRYHAVGLAPMAVEPSQQRAGIGARLVQEGLRVLGERGHQAVVVLGHPTYYPRFGFGPASRFDLRWEHPAPDEAFMALELQPNALARRGGVVRYHAAFDELS